MNHSEQVRRQWLLIKTLASRRVGATLTELAGEFEVSTRSISRDLAMLRDIGFPIEETVEDHGRKKWKIKSLGSTPEMTFQFDEALALYLGRRFLEPLAGTLVWESAQRAFQKVRACLGAQALKYIDQMAVHIHHTSVGAGDYSAQGQIIDQLLQAIEDSHVAIVTYESQKSTEPVEYELEPLGISYHKGSLYLVAHSRDHKERRTFKVNRIRSIEPTRFPFPRPTDFDLSSHLSKSFGVFHGDGDLRVRIRFRREVARYVEEGRWHASQQLRRERDGRLLAEFQLSNTEEIKRWLLSFGGNVEVLSPASLRAEMHEEAQRLVESHVGDGEGALEPAARIEEPRKFEGNGAKRGKTTRAGKVTKRVRAK